MYAGSGGGSSSNVVGMGGLPQAVSTASDLHGDGILHSGNSTLPLIPDLRNFPINEALKIPEYWLPFV